MWKDFFFFSRGEQSDDISKNADNIHTTYKQHKIKKVDNNKDTIICYEYAKNLLYLRYYFVTHKK